MCILQSGLGSRPKFLGLPTIRAPSFAPALTGNVYVIRWLGYGCIIYILIKHATSGCYCWDERKLIAQHVTLLPPPLCGYDDIGKVHRYRIKLKLLNRNMKCSTKTICDRFDSKHYFVRFGIFSRAVESES